MTETTRTVLIALGVSLLVVVLAPLLVCAGGMAMGVAELNNMMGSAEGMGRMSGMMSGMPWGMGGLVLLLLAAGIVSLVIGLRRR